MSTPGTQDQLHIRVRTVTSELIHDVHMPSNAAVAELKQRIAPEASLDAVRLIYQGRCLVDSQDLATALMAAGRESQPFNLHVVVRPSSSYPNASSSLPSTITPHNHANFNPHVPTNANPHVSPNGAPVNPVFQQQPPAPQFQHVAAPPRAPSRAAVALGQFAVLLGRIWFILLICFPSLGPRAGFGVALCISAVYLLHKRLVHPGSFQGRFVVTHTSGQASVAQVVTAFFMSLIPEFQIATAAAE